MKISVLLLVFLTKANAAILSFDEALSQILERSTDIHIQETLVNAADFGVLAAKAAFLPNLSLGGGRGDGLLNGAYTQPVQSLSINSSLNIFHWGSDMAKVTAANSDLETQGASLEFTKLKAEEGAISALAQEILSLQEIEVLRKNAEAFQTYFNIARERYKRGLLPSAEVDKVALDLSNAQARLQDAQSRLALSQAGLAKLLGKSADIKGDWPWKEELKQPKIQELLKEKPNIEKRPDVRAAIYTVNAERARMKTNYWLQYPSLDLSASQGFSENEDGSNQQSTFQLNLRIPIFDRLAQYSQYKIQYETYGAADLRLRQLKIDAEKDWQAANTQFLIALKTTRERDLGLDLSEKLYKINQQRFNQGRASANDLDVDHRRLVESALLAIQGWSEAHIQFTKLCHSIGKSVRSCL